MVALNHRNTHIIPSTLINEDAKHKHWIIPVVETREILKKGGYLEKMIREREPRKIKKTVIRETRAIAFAK